MLKNHNIGPSSMLSFLFAPHAAFRRVRQRADALLPQGHSRRAEDAGPQVRLHHQRQVQRPWGEMSEIQMYETIRNWDRCYDFLNIFAEKFSEKIGVFVSQQSQILKKVDHNIGF
jgi:hypothetical protein